MTPAGDANRAVGRWPFWHTRPAGFGVTGYWPALTGSLAVLIGAPLIGAVLVYGLEWAVPLAEMSPPVPPWRQFLDGIGLLLLGSPLLSWAALLVAVPVSGRLATVGRAGWGVAATAGAIAGLVMMIFVGGGLIFDAEVIGYIACGIVMGLLYWIAIRLIHPAAIGVARKAGTS